MEKSTVLPLFTVFPRIQILFYRRKLPADKVLRFNRDGKFTIHRC